MLNKYLILLLVALSIASCCNSNISSKKIVAVTEENVMFSVSADEIKKSANGPHVVHFDTNSTKLNDATIALLREKVLSEAKNSKTTKVVIEAHCDERGSKNYNQKLSERRAGIVKSYLTENGVEAAKIKAVGYGESKPITVGHDEESWAQNRRAVTISIE